MIRSFGDKDTERIWHGRYVRGLDRLLQRAALRKLELIHAAREGGADDVELVDYH